MSIEALWREVGEDSQCQGPFPGETILPATAPLLVRAVLAVTPAFPGRCGRGVAPSSEP